MLRACSSRFPRKFDNLDFSADYNLLHSQAGARNAVDDPGGSVDDPGGGVIDDKGSFCDPSTSTLTSPKTSASFVTSSLTNRVSLLSLSDKSTVDMIGTTDYATGSFCSLLSWADGSARALCALGAEKSPPSEPPGALAVPTCRAGSHPPPPYGDVRGRPGPV